MVEVPEGRGPNLDTVRGPKGGEGLKGGAPKGGDQNGEGPKFRVFFPLPPKITLFVLSLWASFRGITVVPGPWNVPVWALGLSCETPAALVSRPQHFKNHRDSK